MPEIVRALGAREARQCGGDQIADLVEGTWSGGPEECFEFREGLFDGIEVGTIRREKSQARTGLLNRGADLGLFVSGEIVEHDDIARAQRGPQDLLDVGAEGVIVDRAIEHRRRGQRRGAKCRDDRVRLPVAAWRVIPNARPAQAPGVAA